MKINFKFPEKINLGIFPTPIIKINHFYSSYKPFQVWLKRDDLSGLELSGNKVRKLEYLFRDAQFKKANHVITCGGLQSNHCRTTAFIAAKLGLKCTLFLRGKPDENCVTGNYFLNLLLGSNIKYVTVEEYTNINSIMDEFKEELKNDNETAYVIPEGGSNEMGVWGYIKCFSELQKQIFDQGLPIDTIVVATGSGGTHAGLLLGKILTGSSLKVVSFNVCDSADFFKNKIRSIIYDFSNKYNLPIVINESDIQIIDGYVGEGYGQIGENETELIKDFALSEGIIIDPVYTAKALFGLKDLLQKKIWPDKNSMFIHTGGIFGIFPYHDRFKI